MVPGVHTQPLSFRSKVDMWVGLLILGSLGALVHGAVEHAHMAASLTDAISAMAKPLLVCLIIALVGIPTRYELHETEIVVRSGILRYRVPYQNVRAITPSRNPLSAPAWSLDRLRIDKIAGGYLLVSPKDKQGFLDAVENRATHLVRQDGGLTLRGGPY